MAIGIAMTCGYTSGTIGFDRERSCPDALRFLPLPPPAESPAPPELSPPAVDPRPSADGIGSGVLTFAATPSSRSGFSSVGSSLFSSVSSFERLGFSFHRVGAVENCLDDNRSVEAGWVEAEDAPLLANDRGGYRMHKHRLELDIRALDAAKGRDDKDVCAFLHGILRALCIAIGKAKLLQDYQDLPTPWLQTLARKLTATSTDERRPGEGDGREGKEVRRCSFDFSMAKLKPAHKSSWTVGASELAHLCLGHQFAPFVFLVH